MYHYDDFHEDYDAPIKKYDDNVICNFDDFHQPVPEKSESDKSHKPKIVPTPNHYVFHTDFISYKL